MRPVLARLVQPAGALMARLRYAQKFALIAVVMLAPLAYVAYEHRKGQRFQIDFSAKERLGVEYVRPAADLLIALVEGRDLAVRAAAGDAGAARELPAQRERVEAALRAVGAVDARLGQDLATTPAWDELRGQVETALADGAATSPRAALATWSELTAGAAGLVVAAGDGSNLILDPDLDSYYVMNALVNAVPTLLDSVGHAAALDAAGAGDDDRIALALDQGAIRSTLAATRKGFATSFQQTADARLEPALGPALSEAVEAIDAMMGDVDRAVRAPADAGAADRSAAGDLAPPAGAASRTDREAAAATGDRADAAVAALADFQRRLPDALDRLLVTRIDGFESALRRVTLVALGCALLALYLFAGFYADVRRTVRRLLRSLRSLRDEDVAALGAGLEAVRSGDLTSGVTLTTPEVRADGRDELSEIAADLEAIRRRTAESVAAYEAMRAELRGALGDHSSLEQLTARMRELEQTDLAQLEDALAAMGRGDLTVTASTSTRPLERDGELAAIFDAMLAKAQRSIAGYDEARARMLELLHEIARGSSHVAAASQEMARASRETSGTLEQIAGAVSEVAGGAGEQVAAVADARAAAEEMTAASRRGLDGARETAAAAQAASSLAGEGAAATERATAAMADVRAAADGARDAIHDLDARSRTIGGIVATITGIAEQTNLLALNAAIEAARAGEQGRGFAVVAEEVRKLAEESQQAAGEIGAIVAELQAGTRDAAARIDDGARRTADGVDTVQDTRATFDRLSAAVARMTARVEEIASEAGEVAARSTQVQERMGAIAAVADRSSATTEQVAASTQQTSAAAQQTGASAGDLATTADELRDLVGRFRLA